MKTLQIECEKCGAKEKSVFCDLAHSELIDFESSKVVNNYKPRQTIFYEGNHPYGLYCINSGRIKVYRMDVNGNQQIMRLAGPGDLIGYRCLLADEPYRATAETIEDSTVCFIDRSAFYQLLEKNPQTAFRVMSTLAQDLGEAEGQIMGMVRKNVRERLAELFLTFKTKYGKKTKEGISLDISLTREELADLIGTTQESVIRLISEFKKDEMITVKGRQITIIDAPRLAETANLVD